MSSDDGRLDPERKAPRTLSPWVSYFVLIAAALFLVPALLIAIKGEWRVALRLLCLGGFILFFGAVGWFHYRYPMPPIPPGSSQNLWNEIKRFRQHYPGWQGRLIFYGIPIFFAIVLSLKTCAMIAKL